MDETRQPAQDSLPGGQGQTSGQASGTTSPGGGKDSEDLKRQSDAKAAEGRAKKAEVETELTETKAELEQTKARLQALEQKQERERQAAGIAQKHGVDPFKLVQYADLGTDKLEQLAQDLASAKGSTFPRGDSGLSTGTTGAFDVEQVEKMSPGEVEEKLYPRRK